MSQHVEHSVQTRTAPGSASVVQYEQTKLLPWIMVCCLLAGFAAALATFSMVEAQRSEREARMLQYYLLELDAKAIAAGIKKPEDAISKRLEK